MSRGSPDYAPVAPEVLGAQKYTDYTLQVTGAIPAGSYTTVALGTVTTGYEIYQAVGVISASGCDTLHGLELYINAALKYRAYFEVQQPIFYPRFYIARAGDVMTALFYNWDAVARTFVWAGIGTYLTIGSPKLHPSPVFGKKPKLKANEVLCQVEDTMFGKRWVKSKYQKIAEGSMEMPTPFIPEIEEIIENGS